MDEWVRSRTPIPGLTLIDRDFARLVAITVCAMEAWELNVLGGRPIMWRRLPLAVTIRPEWDILVERYDFNELYGLGALGFKPFYDSVIVEARKIRRISMRKENA